MARFKIMVRVLTVGGGGGRVVVPIEVVVLAKAIRHAFFSGRG